MNLQEFNSPLPKPWLQINCDTLTANEVRAVDRVRQDGGHLSSYGLWSALSSNVFGGSTSPIFAMGSFVGPVLIPAASCYNGMSIRIVAGGLINMAGVDTVTFSIRDLAGTFTHASCSLTSGGVLGNVGAKVEFNIQVLHTGGTGTGVESATSHCIVSTANGSVNSAVNNTTFDTTNGIELYLYVQFGVNTSSFTRQMAYATVMN